MGPGEQSELAESGYVRPYFQFVSHRLFPIKEDVDPLIEELEKERGINSGFELLNGLVDHRDALLKQIERQAKKVQKINQEILDVIKVYYHETVSASQASKNEDHQREKEIDIIVDNLKVLFTQAIKKGAYPEDIKEQFLSQTLTNNKYLSEHIRYGTIRGIEKLVDKREPVLKIAEVLSRKVNNLESLIEMFMMDEALTWKFFKRRNMPDPAEVAKNIIRPEYDPKVIEKTMIVTREYILKGKLDEAYGHIASIERAVRASNITEPSKNTIRNWIETYCEACQIL